MKKFNSWADKNFIVLSMAPATIYLLVISTYITVSLIYLSLCNWNVSSPSPSYNGLFNFISLIKDYQFWSSAWKTIIFMTISVGLEIILGMSIALLLNGKIRGLGVFRTLFILPMAVTPVVSGLIWRILYDPTLGLINYLLSFFGIAGPAWVAQSNTALFSVILVDVWQWTPFAFLVITAGLQSIPGEPYEAAAIDGATSFQTFRFITLPLLKQVFLVLILFRGIDTVKTFDIIYVITAGGPGSATQTLVYYTYLKGFSWFDLGYAATLAIVLLYAITFIVQRFIKYSGVSVIDVS